VRFAPRGASDSLRDMVPPPAARPLLRPDQFERYRRHLALPEFGVDAQRRLLASRVLLIGAGGLGCPVAQYLAAAGVGTLGLVDSDVVDASNLQRQILYGVRDVGRPKTEVARERILAQNPDVKVETHAVRLSSANALAMLADYDVVVDGADNFPTRYLANDACALLGKPNVHGSIFRFEGQAIVFDARRGPCYRCLYPEPPPPGSMPSCSEGGVLGVLPGLVALVQATETVKLLAGIGEPLIGRLLVYDALAMRFAEYELQKDPDCPLCGERRTLVELVDYDGLCGVEPAAEVREKSAAEVAAMRARGERFLLLDVREPEELERSRIEGAEFVQLGRLEAEIERLASWRDETVVVLCHKGGRSARAAGTLSRHGFRDVWSLAGGIEAWSLTVDPHVVRY